VTWFSSFSHENGKSKCGRVRYTLIHSVWGSRTQLGLTNTFRLSSLSNRISSSHKLLNWPVNPCTLSPIEIVKVKARSLRSRGASTLGLTLEAEHESAEPSPRSAVCGAKRDASAKSSFRSTWKCSPPITYIMYGYRSPRIREPGQWERSIVTSHHHHSYCDCLAHVG
jgi:hypothetical protein